jgi:hypothetical protein
MVTCTMSPLSRFTAPFICVKFVYISTLITRRSRCAVNLERGDTVQVIMPKRYIKYKIISSSRTYLAVLSVLVIFCPLGPTLRRISKSLDTVYTKCTRKYWQGLIVLTDKVASQLVCRNEHGQLGIRFCFKQDVARYVVLRIPPLVHLCQICIYLNTHYQKK